MVIVVDGFRFWAVEGDAEVAGRIEEITGCETVLVSVLSFDSFLSQFSKHDAFRPPDDEVSSQRART